MFSIRFVIKEHSSSVLKVTYFVFVPPNHTDALKEKNMKIQMTTNTMTKK